MIKIEADTRAEGTVADIEIKGYRSQILAELAYAAGGVIHQLFENATEEELIDTIAAVAAQMFHDATRTDAFTGNTVTIDVNAIKNLRGHGNE
jgi:hypothetical protein